jgi:hypothetical protein
MNGNGKQSMFGASSFLRWVSPILACALAVISAQQVPAATLDLSLNVYYSNPSNPASNGTWQLFAKSSDFGIASVRTFITGIDNTPDLQNQAPRGTFSGGGAGMSVFADTEFPANNPTPAYHEVIFGQIPRPIGSAQGEFYGIGTIVNGHPGDVGPPIPTLANPQGIPWAATGDPLGNSTWNTGVLLTGGTFAAGLTPAFFTGDEPFLGQVFDGTNSTGGPLSGTNFGHEIAATVSSIVRTNLAPSADYSHNGFVDAADYVMWRKTLGTTVPIGSGADGYADGTIDNLDYFWWRSHFGLTGGAAAGLNSDLSTSAVPEPASCALFVFAAMLAFAPRVTRKRRAMHS